MKTYILPIGAIVSIAFLLSTSPLRADASLRENLLDRCSPRASTGCNPCDTAVCAPCDPIGSDPCRTLCDDPRGDLVSFPLFEPKNRCGRKRSLFEQIEVYGWIQAGIYGNNRGGTTERSRIQNYRGREVSSFGISGNSPLLSTVQSTDFQVNQLWIGMKKEADGRRGLDWGFNVDYLLGPEAWFCQSWGDAKFDYGWKDGDYSSAIPVACFQLAYGDFSLKMGKYETLVGYEAFRAPDAFFYSHSHLFMMEPYSHSGALLEYAPNDRLYIGLGYTTGGDASLENKYDDHGFLGELTYQLTSRLSASYRLHYSRYGGGLYPNEEIRWFGENDVYFQTVGLTYELSPRLQYLFQWNYGDAKDRASSYHRRMYGITNTLLYKLNRTWSLGFRAEWTKECSPAEFGYVGFYSGEIQAYTLGLNWKPYTNISVRPEIRYDCAQDRVFNNNRRRDQMSAGICFVYSL